ncbi:uncharacterized protein LOC126379275 isoform X2 [Pectinophora gossypiella]|uniref:uncharacterized protein LOC126379275 isoform X2 n=1 Tax=Pectinophora gossypiella TaxID=13191 RepID=UPI00214E4D43|nr:uncharacterized protein LOC126379275 isoform X2 [Pectinophora gossypiella]
MYFSSKFKKRRFYADYYMGFFNISDYDYSNNTGSGNPAKKIRDYNWTFGVKQRNTHPQVIYPHFCMFPADDTIHGAVPNPPHRPSERVSHGHEGTRRHPETVPRGPRTRERHRLRPTPTRPETQATLAQAQKIISPASSHQDIPWTLHTKVLFLP